MKMSDPLSIGNARINSDSSDDECLAEVKRKTRENDPIPMEYNDRFTLSSVTIKVEQCSDVEEMPPEYNNLQSTKVYIPEPTPTKAQSKRPKISEETRRHEFSISQGIKNEIIELQVQINKSRNKCKKCGKSYKRSKDMKVHVQNCFFQKPHVCDICNRHFTLEVDLARHKKMHTSGPLKCLKCSAEFEEREQLDEHENKVHSDDKVCTICGIRGQSLEEIQWHMSTYHNISISCQYCGEQFPSPRERDAHLEEAHGDEAMECGNCAQKFNCKCNGEGSSIPMQPETLLNDMEVEPEVNNDSLDTAEQMYVQCMYDVTVKREDLSYPTQCAIVSKMHKGRSVADVCKLYQITPEVVNEIWEDREKFSVPKKIGMRSTRYMNSVLDAKILEWFHRQRSNGIQITGKMLINVAEEYAKECGFVAFNGSVKWLDRFKGRHQISLRSTPVKREKVRPPNEAKWKDQFLNEVWVELRKKYSDEDIYTADEVGVFYNPSKGRVKKHAGKKFIHGFDKDRLSIFMCTNIPTSDKRKLLVCGSEDPLAHSHRDPNTLPVNYIRHTHAHFTTSMFEDYVKSWNIQLSMQNRKIALILDRASIHSKLPLSHLKLVFVPWKASIGLMPIKHGIFTGFREEFRKLILQEKAMNIMRGVDRYFTCLEALEMLDKAWHRVSAQMVIESFETVGYGVLNKTVQDEKISPRVTEKDDENICKMLENYDIEPYFTDVSNLDMFLTVEEELLTGVGTNGSVFGGNHRVSDPVLYGEMEKDEILPIATERSDVERKKLITKARALEDLEIVRKYLETNDTSFKMFSAFMDVEKVLLRNPPKTQT